MFTPRFQRYCPIVSAGPKQRRLYINNKSTQKKITTISNCWLCCIPYTGFTELHWKTHIFVPDYVLNERTVLLLS